MNLNAITRLISSQFAIPAGSPEWSDGGMQAKPFTTGGHAAYGWSWDHLWSEQWAKAVLANALDRPVFYLDEPKRRLTYEQAGRPILVMQSSVWIGETEVYGMDLSHFHIGPLLLVCDRGESIPVDFLGMPSNAAQLARWTVRLLMAQLAGMIRTNNGYWMGDRPGACMLRATTGALKRGLVNEEDLSPLLGYFDLMLTRYTEPRLPDSNSVKHSESSLTPVPNKPYYRQIYNGPSWLLPAMHDALPLLQGDRLDLCEDAILDMSWLMLRLKELDALGCAGISYPDSQIGLPDTDYYWLTKENVHYDADDHTEWSLRAMAVASETLGFAWTMPSGFDKRWAVGA